MMANAAIAVLGRIVQKFFGLFGLAVVRRLDSQNQGTMEAAVARIASRKQRIATIVDIGASNGSWSRMAMRHFPMCRYLLIDAQDVHEPALQAFCTAQDNAEFVLAAAGEAIGSIYFDVGDPLGGQASSTPYASNNAIVPVTTVDHEVSRRGLRGPFMLKFDTHGYELPILKGASHTLLDTEAIVMECYNYKISESCLLFDEMCAYLKQHGFRCIDLASPLFRPYDGTFWQMDLVFVRSDRPEFDYVSYR